MNPPEICVWCLNRGTGETSVETHYFPAARSERGTAGAAQLKARADVKVRPKERTLCWWDIRLFQQVLARTGGDLDNHGIPGRLLE